MKSEALQLKAASERFYALLAKEAMEGLYRPEREEMEKCAKIVVVLRGRVS